MNSGKDRKAVEKTILQIFQDQSGNKELSLLDITKGNDRGKEAVKTYQRNVVGSRGTSVDGIITNGQKTFNVLRCHIADKMNITLTNKPTICKSAKF